MVKVYEIDPEADALLIIPPSTTASNPPSSELRIKVSSKHLSLASNKFRTTLASTAPSDSDGRKHIPLPGFDPSAVTIVANNLHGHGRRAPRILNLETLAQVALFAAAYQLCDAVDIYADRWVAALLQQQHSLPTEPGRELALWIYVSHVFRMPSLFASLTRLAISQGRGGGGGGALVSDAQGLPPIKEKLLRDIETKRQQVASQAAALLHSLLEDLQEGEYATATATHHPHDSLLIGELLKSLRRHKLQHITLPQPASKPFHNDISLGALLDVVQDVQARMRRYFYSNNDAAPPLGLDATTTAPARTKDSSTTTITTAPQQPTPDASPELRPADGGPAASGSGSEVDDALAGLRRDLEALERGVVGLDLEDGRGYSLY